MNVEKLVENLSLFSPLQVDLRINDNISTYLSVLERTKRKIRLSLHKLFLNAPLDICEAVMRYSLYRDKQALQSIRVYSHSYFTNTDYSKKIEGKRFSSKGKYVDLKEIYDRLNQTYFDNKLNIQLTWFPKPTYKKRSSITFGSYNRSLKLIRINKILDNPRIPLYFIEFIMFHEMLHDVCPPEVDRAGRLRVHTPLFRQKEKEFPFYQQAISWEKNIWVRGYGRT